MPGSLNWLLKHLYIDSDIAEQAKLSAIICITHHCKIPVGAALRAVQIQNRLPVRWKLIFHWMAGGQG